MHATLFFQGDHMKVTVKKQDGTQQNDYRHAYSIDVDDKQVVFFMDGEPEDANLNRDFNDVYNIPVLIAQAHTAGLRGEQLTLDVEEVEEI